MMGCVGTHVATAKAHDAPLLTRDRAITDSGAVEIVW
jgi:hypothetical protein